MSPRKIPDSVLSKSLTTHAAIDRLVSGIEEIERDFNPGKCISNPNCAKRWSLGCVNSLPRPEAVRRRDHESSARPISASLNSENRIHCLMALLYL